MARRSADDPEDVAFLHDDEVFTADFHLGARPFAEQNLVAGLDVQRRDLAVVGAGAGANGDDFAFLRLFLRRIGNDDPAGGLCLGLDSADEDAVMKRPETHGCYPSFIVRLNMAVSTPAWRVPTMQRIWLWPVHPSTGRRRLFGYAWRGWVSPSLSRSNQRASISAATTASPLAKPTQMPTPFQSAAKASQAPIPSPTTQ